MYTKLGVIVNEPRDFWTSGSSSNLVKMYYIPKSFQELNIYK